MLKGMKRFLLSFLMMACAGVAGAADGTLAFADGLARRGMVRQAAQEYEAILKKSPNDEASFALAGCYEKLGWNDKAREIYRELAGRLTGNRQAAARLRLAVSLLYKGDRPEEALTLLQAVADGATTEETKQVARLNLGRCLARLGRTDEAEKVLSQVASGTGLYAAQAKAAQAELLLNQGKTTEAWSYYRVALAEAPKEERASLAADAFGRMAAATSALDAAKQDEAYAQAARLAQVAGKEVLGRSGLLPQAAYAAYRAKRPDEAKAWLDAEKALRPSAKPDRLLFEGTLAESLGDDTGALTAYERVLSEFPNTPETPQAAQAMLTLRARAGVPADFLKAWGRVAGKLSQEARLTLEPSRLDAATRAKDLSQARASATWLMENAPAEQAADAGYRLGLMEQQTGDLAQAGETWLRTAERWPSAPMAGYAAYAAAYVFAQTKQPERVERALGLALGSGDATVAAEALLFRARTALSEGDTAAAAATLDEYLSRFPSGQGVAEAAYWRGILFFNAQDFQAAERLLAQALAISGEQGPKPLDHARRTDAAMRRAQSLHALGREDEAAALLQPIVALKDAQGLAPEYLAWLAAFRAERKEWPEAEAAARALVARGGANRAWGNLRLAQAAEAQGQQATAIAAYESALNDSANALHAAEAAVGLGRLRAKADEQDAARVAFETAVSKADVNTPEGLAIAMEAHARLAATYAALGQKDKALRENFFLITCFDDREVVPPAFRAAIAELEAQGRTEEAQTLRAEFAQRYPDAAKE